MVVVVEVVVVVLRGARAHEEGEHEGEEENADGGGTRGTSGKHGVCECVRAQDGCVETFFIKTLPSPADRDQSDNAQKTEESRKYPLQPDLDTY